MALRRVAYRVALVIVWDKCCVVDFDDCMACRINIRQIRGVSLVHVNDIAYRDPNVNILAESSCVA